jgi:hypothetical protein
MRNIPEDFLHTRPQWELEIHKNGSLQTKCLSYVTFREKGIQLQIWRSFTAAAKMLTSSRKSPAQNRVCAGPGAQIMFGPGHTFFADKKLLLPLILSSWHSRAPEANPSGLILSRIFVAAPYQKYFEITKTWHLALHPKVELQCDGKVT